MGTLEIKHLKLIKTIAETGNLTKSAKRLKLSQPALSRQLINLEDHLGASLFIRSHKAMTLTDVGLDILDIANEVLEKIDQSERMIARKLKGDIGELRIGVHCVFCFRWLPALVKQFQKHFPKVELEINNSLNFIKDLSRHKMDLVITPFRLKSEFIQYVPLFSDHIVMVSAPDHSLCNKEEIQLHDFQNNNYLSPVPRAYDPFYTMFLKPNGVEPKKYMLVNQTGALIELVKTGMGLSAFPKWAVQDIIKSGELGSSSIKSPASNTTWYAARRLNQIYPNFQKEFIHLVQRNVGGSFCLDKSFVGDQIQNEPANT